MSFKGSKIILGLVICITFLSFPVKAQLLDTIQYSLHQKPKFFLTLASFNTFIDGQFANITRVKFGLNYNEKVRLGISISDLANNDVVTPIRVSENQYEYTTNGRLLFSNVGISAEYFFYNDYPWQFGVAPLNIGFGKARYEYYSRLHERGSSTPSEMVIIYQPEISAQYSIFKWIGVGVTTGYRLTLYRSREATQNLNAPLFAIDIRLFVDEVYQALFYPEEKKN